MHYKWYCSRVINALPLSFGGSTDTANTARRVLSPEMRNAFVSLFRTEGFEEPNLRLTLMMLNVVARIVNSLRKIDVDKFEKFCTDTYLQLLRTFPFCNIAISVSRMLMHCCEKMRASGNRGLGHFSENWLTICITFLFIYLSCWPVPIHYGANCAQQYHLL